MSGRKMKKRTWGTKAAAFVAATGAVITGSVAVQAFGGSGGNAAGGIHMAAAAGVVDCHAAFGPTPAHTSFLQPLPIPTKVDRRDSTTPVHLFMKTGTHVFQAGIPAAKTMGYALSSTATDVYGGPTIEMAKGTPLTLKVTNALGAHPLANFVDENVMGTQAMDAAMPRGTVHLHGAHSEAKFDGLPNSTFSPGHAFTYTYGNDQDATGLWYHDHAWGLTRLQVTAGLAGQVWLRDRYDTGDSGSGLHLPSGQFEVPLTLQDRTFNADGQLSYPIGPHCGISGLPADYPNQWNPESFGDVATVNGAMEPNMNVSKATYRFRVLNGSNARFYHLRLAQLDAAGNPMSTSLPFSQIGTDGGLLNAPVTETDILLAPAERADLLIDFSELAPGTTFRLLNDALAPYPGGGDSTLPQVMQFTVTGRHGVVLPIPTTLRGGRDQPALLPEIVAAGSRPEAGALNAASKRTIFLNEISDDLTNPDPLGPSITGEPVHVMVGNQFYGSSSTMQPRTHNVEAPAINTVEEWDIVNTTGDAHPIHIHLTQFRLLNRQAITTDVNGDTNYVLQRLNCNGADARPNHCVAAPGLPNPEVAGTGPWPAPAPDRYLTGPVSPASGTDLGWKDTIITYPGTVTRIIVPFGGTAAGIPSPYIGDAKGAAVQRFVGQFVFHCHILEHEDNDMMSPMNVH